MYIDAFAAVSICASFIFVLRSYLCFIHILLEVTAVEDKR